MSRQSPSGRTATWRTATLVAVGIMASAGALRGQLAAAPQTPEASVGVLIVAHGGGPEWNAMVEQMAREVAVPGPVGVSFLMGPGAAASRLQNVEQDLIQRGAQRIVIVPLLVSSFSGHFEQIRYLARETDSLDAEMLHHLEMAGITRGQSDLPVQVTGAMDDAPELAEVVTARALAMATDPTSEAVFIVGHGPSSSEEYAAWMENLRRVASAVHAQGKFRSVLVDLLKDDAPPAVRAEAVRRIRELIELQYAITGREVLVVPLLVAPGYISRQKLPTDLADLPIRYSGETLLPNPAIARWVETTVVEID